MANPREPRVAVVGATGAVGLQIVELIAARDLPRTDLKLFATESGASGTLEAGDEEYLVEMLAAPDELADFDVAFLAIPESAASEIVAASPGPILIDLSAAGRTPSAAAPMVAPGITSRAQIAELRATRVFAIPHPSALALATCLNAIGPDAGPFAATAMHGASANGRASITRLVNQTTDLLSARLELEEDEIQRAFNAFMRETERALADKIVAQAAAMTSVRADALNVQVVAIPVLHGSAVAIHSLAHPADDAWIERLRSAPGVLLAEENEPLSITDAVGQEAIIVRAESGSSGAALWCVFDNARLAALGALWIAEMFAMERPVGN